MSDRQRDIERIASWGGFILPPAAADRLAELEDWISNEAIPAGGVGPNEAERLWERHILDSSLFAGFVEANDSVLDIGSGAGLPGLVVAVLRPDCQMTLLDRAGRRCDLARRAVRVLGVHNVEVVQGELAGYSNPHSLALSRASLPPDELLGAVSGIAGLKAVVAAGSRITAPQHFAGWESVEIPAELVGDTIWMLRARLSEDQAG